MSSFKDAATPSTASADRLTGRVKWFNNKAGYGFITATDGSHSVLIFLFIIVLLALPVNNTSI
jgi:hypothetical protein